MNIIKQLINGFIKSELDLFKKRFYESTAPEIQDRRSLAIAWVCYYYKDFITTTNKLSIVKFVDSVYKNDQYTTKGWYRISALESAAYIISSNIDYANRMVQSIACGQSWARGFILESAGIICPLLSFKNLYLKRATETNIRMGQGGYEESIILYLSSKGTLKEKKNWIEQRCLDQKGFGKEFCDKLKNNSYLYETQLFIKELNLAKSYFIFKLTCHPTLDTIEVDLFDEIQPCFEELIEKENKHPLKDYYFDLSFLKDK